ncbi:hypothetical protein ACFQ1L_23030 [Phytohabitans flavus]|uniref:hypothetical protein n=1 Tax=Phytohabitans flavus TaxID=1076124 RepID=UPI00363E68CC
MADKSTDKSRSTEQIQADHAIRAMGGADEVGIVRSGQPAEIHYMYRKGCMLVREEAVGKSGPSWTGTRSGSVTPAVPRPRPRHGSGTRSSRWSTVSA